MQCLNISTEYTKYYFSDNYFELKSKTIKENEPQIKSSKISFNIKRNSGVQKNKKTN